MSTEKKPKRTHTWSLRVRYVEQRRQRGGTLRALPDPGDAEMRCWHCHRTPAESAAMRGGDCAK